MEPLVAGRGASALPTPPGLQSTQSGGPLSFAQWSKHQAQQRKLAAKPQPVAARKLGGGPLPPGARQQQELRQQPLIELPSSSPQQQQQQQQEEHEQQHDSLDEEQSSSPSSPQQGPHADANGGSGARFEAFSSEDNEWHAVDVIRSQPPASVLASGTHTVRIVASGKVIDVPETSLRPREDVAAPADAEEAPEAEWKSINNTDAFAGDNAYACDHRSDAEARRVCVERGFGGFVVWRGTAFFRKQTASELRANACPVFGAVLHLAPEGAADAPIVPPPNEAGGRAVQCAGVVAFAPLDGDPLGGVLLVRQRRNNQWGFPKGHVSREDGGSLERTARREFREETGLPAGTEDLRMLLLDGAGAAPRPAHTQRYEAAARADTHSKAHAKAVHFFAAIVPGRLALRAARFSSREIAEVRLCPVGRALGAVLPYDEQRATLRAVHAAASGAAFVEPATADGAQSERRSLSSLVAEMDAKQAPKKAPMIKLDEGDFGDNVANYIRMNGGSGDLGALANPCVTCLPSYLRAKGEVKKYLQGRPGRFLVERGVVTLVEVDADDWRAAKAKPGGGDGGGGGGGDDGGAAASAAEVPKLADCPTRSPGGTNGRSDERDGPAPTAELARARDTVAELRAQVERQAREAQALRDAADAAKAARLASDMAANAQLRGQVARQAAVIEQQKRDIAALRAANLERQAAATTAGRDWQARAADAEQARRDLARRVERQAAVIAQQTRDLAELGEHCRATHDEANALLHGKIDQNVKLLHEVRQKDRALAGKTRAIESKDTAVYQLHKALKESESYVRSTKAQNALLRTSLADAERRAEGAESTAAAAQNMAADLNQQIKEHQGAIRTGRALLARQAAEASASLAQMQERAAAAEKRAASFATVILEENTHKIAAAKAAAEASASLARAEALNETLRRENESLAASHEKESVAQALQVSRIALELAEKDATIAELQQQLGGGGGGDDDGAAQAGDGGIVKIGDRFEWNPRTRELVMLTARGGDDSAAASARDKHGSPSSAAQPRAPTSNTRDQRDCVEAMMAFLGQLRDDPDKRYPTAISGLGTLFNPCHVGKKDAQRYKKVVQDAGGLLSFVSKHRSAFDIVTGRDLSNGQLGYVRLAPAPKKAPTKSASIDAIAPSVVKKLQRAVRLLGGRRGCCTLNQLGQSAEVPSEIRTCGMKLGALLRSLPQFRCWPHATEKYVDGMPKIMVKCVPNTKHAAEVKLCFECGTEQREAKFSKTQWGKGEETATRRCKACISPNSGSDSGTSAKSGAKSFMQLLADSAAKPVSRASAKHVRGLISAAASLLQDRSDPTKACRDADSLKGVLFNPTWPHHVGAGAAAAYKKLSQSAGGILPFLAQHDAAKFELVGDSRIRLRRGILPAVEQGGTAAPPAAASDSSAGGSGNRGFTFEAPSSGVFNPFASETNEDGAAADDAHRPSEAAVNAVEAALAAAAGALGKYTLSIVEGAAVDQK